MSISGNGQPHSTSTLSGTRWRPSRSGLLNFYRYDDQEFHFHQGRLLLRGNNGTGKSRVLALQLPFLLDGEMSPERVEPDGDKAKRFEWNLLTGKHADRLGYTWIEFERVGEDGVAQHLTLGCGARAAAGRGIIGKWFFTTARRVGHDLSLCSSQGNPLPKDSLIETLGNEGRVFTTASTYREDVNHRLYGMPQERYNGLIKLLIELRQPQLSKNLDEKTLSAAMSDSLPPVSPRIIQQVSDAMRAMEQDRSALADLQSARESAESFLIEYRRYAQIIACRRSEEVRKAHSDYEKRHRKLRETESDCDAALKRAERLQATEDRLSLELAAAQGRKTTLENSPQMRSARDLENIRKQSQQRREEANRKADEYRRSVESLSQVTAEHAADAEQAGVVAARLESIATESDQCAVACGLERPHRTGAARASLPRPNKPEIIDQSERSLSKTWDERRAASRVLRELNAEVQNCRKLWQGALDRQDAQAGRVEESRNAYRASDAGVAQTLRDLLTAYREWFGSLSLLAPSAPPDVSLAIQIWNDGPMAQAGPVRSAVDRALSQFRKNAATERAAKVVELNELQSTLQLLSEERERLLSGQHQPPPPPYTRDLQSRRDRAGAPLWQLCEFVEGVSDDHRAGIEAALESAGVLDAWVNPDGHVTASEAFDTFLREDGEVRDGVGLLHVLRPSPHSLDGAVSSKHIENILRQIGFGEGTGGAWVDATGRWQVGVLSGRWAKPVAQHIGQAAREAERLRRIQELEVRINEIRPLLSTCRSSIEMIDARSGLADAEAGLAPSEDGVRNAVARRDAQRKHLDQDELRLHETQVALDQAKDDLQDKTNHRNTSAADLGLSDWIDRVQELDDALNEYRQILVRLWSAAREHVRALLSVDAAKLRLDRERQRSEDLAVASHAAAQAAADAESQYDTLHRTIGAAVEEVQRQLRDAEASIERINKEQKKNAGEVGATAERIELLKQSVIALSAEIEDDTARRAAAIDRLLRFTRTALIDITDDTLAGVGRGEMAVTSAVELARQIGSTLEQVDSDENAWTLTQRAIHNHIQNLTNALQGHDYRPQTITEDDTLVVTAPLHGVQRPMREFIAMLADEIVNRRSLLTAKELALLENYLIHDVAVELGRLIRESEELVAGMNRQLLSRPNSTGMTLRFKWEPQTDGPVAFAEARKKLLGDHATWSPIDRAALGQFLQEQINRARDADAASTWQEQLSTALDYRRWHQFYVERRQENRWVRLTRQTHGTGSSGEKAVALTIPRFAAASAYYDSAASYAPRLILLDEAFVGIDRYTRGKLMGLLHEFDLDFVMTSEIEWGCYQAMPGLAIYQLSARADIDAVLASRWVWNGRERVLQNPDVAMGNSHPVVRNDLFGSDATDATS